VKNLHIVSSRSEYGYFSLVPVSDVCRETWSRDGPEFGQTARHLHRERPDFESVLGNTSLQQGSGYDLHALMVGERIFFRLKTMSCDFLSDSLFSENLR